VHELINKKGKGGERGKEEFKRQKRTRGIKEWGGGGKDRPEKVNRVTGNEGAARRAQNVERRKKNFKGVNR